MESHENNDLEEDMYFKLLRGFSYVKSSIFFLPIIAKAGFLGCNKKYQTFLAFINIKIFNKIKYLIKLVIWLNSIKSLVRPKWLSVSNCFYTPWLENSRSKCIGACKKRGESKGIVISSTKVSKLF